jgi:PqqD family protein of HPr-rel-A system
MDGERWRLERRTQLHWRNLDSEWVVFDASSGDTHRLDYLSAAALMCLEEGPQDVGHLTAILGGELGLTDEAGLTRNLESLLGQLKRLGLIEPADR